MSESDSTDELKCLIVGENGCGKSALLYTFLNGKFPDGDQLEPKLAEVTRTVGEYSVVFKDSRNSMIDDRDRLLGYPYCNIVLMCFDMTSKESIAGLDDKWLVEITHHCQEQPALFLVGLKSEGSDVITQSEIQAAMGQNFRKSFTLSAKNDPARIKEVFEEMVATAGQERKKNTKVEEKGSDAAVVPKPDAAKPRRGCSLF
eukprot:TRINITY_DN2557_c0_g1_i1.p1 TRINITY_DN2557_c0_g1~~TRINITY_DN2557_c0_g1_i1.p1  ORF type:complete len:202 (-),score=35.21 TRINITY_DN2557_c0_g1_i1:490-1095(-)